MSETQKAAAAKAITASTNKTFKVRRGDVVSVGVKVEGTQKPTITTPDGRNLLIARDASGSWVGSWVSMEAGEHQLVAAIPDQDPVLFSVTTTDEEN